MRSTASHVFYLILICILLAAVTFAATPGQQPVSFKSGQDTVNGVLFVPADAAHKKLPAIVVIHEWWGLNDWVKEQAQRFSQQGYVTLAVDLYRGKVTADADEAHELMRGLPPERAVQDMRAAFLFLKTRKDVDGQRIGAIGWCMGGGLAMRLAVNEPALRAVVVNYGAPVNDDASLKKVHASLLGIFGGQDRGISVNDAQKMAAQLKTAGKKAEIKIYPDAGHGFENPNNKSGYRAQDAADAFKLQDEFSAHELKH